MERNKKIQSVTAALLAGLVLALSCAFFIMEKRDFSESENRYLKKFPEFSWEDLKSGNYTADLQSYLSDHFPFRDVFMGLKAEAEIAMGKREINGIYIADDGYLIEEYKTPKNTEKAIGNFRKFYDSVDSAEVKLMLVPTAVSVYQDKLPAYAPDRAGEKGVPGSKPGGRQMETMKEIYEKSGVPGIPCYEALKAAGKVGQAYYRTDHHWTTWGAYAAYQAYCEEKGIVPTPLEAFRKKEVSSSFRGTIYSKLNDGRMGKDSIVIYEYPEDKLTVDYTDTKEVTDSLYNFDYLDKKDKYSMFLNNIHPLIEITNETADSDRELVLIKDSYANSMVPFLVRHYRKMYVFDTRYYKKGPSSFIKEHPEVTDVLILYNMNTLDTDLGIGGIY